MIYPQMLLDLNGEIIVDLFAGGGGASSGIEQALGRTVDVAVNHDAAAVAMHRVNHPQTAHHQCDVFEVDPREVSQGRPIGLLWASPDCTFHSKARGAKPIRRRDRKRRALAWVVTRWAGQVRPRVIMLENVEEFADWGPLVGPPNKLVPCRRRRGRTFRTWRRSLERLGYRVDKRELRACDYGAPTIRKRLFVIARCDGQPITWPEPTHGPGRRIAYRTAAECIDWSIPMLSIFATKAEARAFAKWHHQGVPVRPLAEATLRRTARGVMRYVVNNPEPFIVGVGGRAGQSPERSTRAPLQTVTAKGDAAVVAPVLVPNNTNNAPQSVDAPVPTITGGGRMILAAAGLVPRYGERAGQDPRVRSIEEPAPVVVPTGNGGSLVAGFLAKHFGGVVGSPLDQPKGTVTTIDHDSLVAAHLSSYHGERRDGEVRAGGVDQPVSTIDTSNRYGLVAAFLQKYYGADQDPRLEEPLHTVTSKDRFGLVTVTVSGEPYILVDIAMRMLQPRELYSAQGFHRGYVIDFGEDELGQRRIFTKTEKVRMCGNSVCPPVAAALARANVPDLIVRDVARRIA